MPQHQFSIAAIVFCSGAIYAQRLQECFFAGYPYFSMNQIYDMPFAQQLGNFRWRRLKNRYDKPLDFGGGGINGSVSRMGQIIAINVFHPEHGYVTLSGIPPFPENLRYQPDAVRAYRRSLAAAVNTGVGSRSDVSSICYLLEDAAPLVVTELPDAKTRVGYLTLVLDELNCVVQLVGVSTDSGAAEPKTAAGLDMRSGNMRLMRCAYTQLTEGGPLPMPSTNTIIREINLPGAVGIENPALPYAVVVSGASGIENGDGSVDIQYHELAAGQELTAMIVHGLGMSIHDAQANAEVARALGYDGVLANINAQLKKWKKRWQGVSDDLPLRRGLVYGMNCVVPVDSEAGCILTDHMLLPLSWNRDAYYVARALFNWNREMHKLIRSHLIWMFERTARVEGAWGRAYLANGKIKDRGFQLDQQIFPLLELAEYVLETGDADTLDRLRPQIKATLNLLMARKTADEWLFPTEETPADDPIAYPYHLSSHILLWRTLSLLARLDGLSADTGIPEMIVGVRGAIDKYFIADKDGVKIYAYATDGLGNHHFYHDANDVPLVYAADWGMIAGDSPIWRATIDFAFSDANEDGYYDGHLGSVHTRAAWPLGDVQEIIVAQAVGDKARETKARASIESAAQWDGALPEAYDPKKTLGNVISRHWFAWPNAMLACLDLKPIMENNP